MRTNIEIDDEMIAEAQQLLGARSKRETVEMALREVVARLVTSACSTCAARCAGRATSTRVVAVAEHPGRSSSTPASGSMSCTTTRRGAARCVELIEGGEPAALTEIVFTEILQGRSSEREASLVEAHLRDSIT